MRNWYSAACASATRSFSGVTRKISYPCRFPADGAAFAAASTCATFSASTAWRVNARTDRRLLITSNRSTTRIIPFGTLNGWRDLLGCPTCVERAEEAAAQRWHFAGADYRREFRFGMTVWRPTQRFSTTGGWVDGWTWAESAALSGHNARRSSPVVPFCLSACREI